MDLVAQFLANGGTVTQVPEGERAVSAGQMYDLERAEAPRKPKMAELSTFGKMDHLTGGTLSDAQLLAMSEMHDCQ